MVDISHDCAIASVLFDSYGKIVNKCPAPIGVPLFLVGGWLIFLSILLSHEPMSMYVRTIGIVAECVGLPMSGTGVYLLATLRRP